ncbi:uncharacterized protein G2W53_017751 [Senna tora]|uniref:Uncharacterized protein n=1 Tax=Senna tora TaxID=362788 RepID=A0A834TSI5_9FABA|nr:uncharacterized protein G2W53_017751 [Senna tora]
MIAANVVMKLPRPPFIRCVIANKLREYGIH